VRNSFSGDRTASAAARRWWRRRLPQNIRQTGIPASARIECCCKVVATQKAAVAHFGVDANQIDGDALQGVIGVDVGKIQLAVGDLVDHFGSLAPQDHSFGGGETGLQFLLPGRTPLIPNPLCWMACSSHSSVSKGRPCKRRSLYFDAVFSTTVFRSSPAMMR
jgi:hypothetical protein